MIAATRRKTRFKKKDLRPPRQRARWRKEAGVRKTIISLLPAIIHHANKVLKKEDWTNTQAYCTHEKNQAGGFLHHLICKIIKQHGWYDFANDGLTDFNFGEIKTMYVNGSYRGTTVLGVRHTQLKSKRPIILFVYDFVNVGYKILLTIKEIYYWMPFEEELIKPRNGTFRAKMRNGKPVALNSGNMIKLFEWCDQLRKLKDLTDNLEYN